MKNKLIFGLCALLLGSNSYTQTVDEKLKALENRIEELEYAGYENFFKISGMLEYQHHSTSTTDNKAFTYKKSDGNDVTVAVGHDKVDTNKLHFNLNLVSNPSDDLNFYGRLAMTKYFNLGSKIGSYNDETGFSEYYQGASGAFGSGLYVERAFGNYKINNSLTFSMGRLPTIDGPPKHTSRGEALNGNYPLLAFAAIFDGMALTYSKNFSKGSFRFKTVYTPFSALDVNNTTNRVGASDNSKWKPTADAWSFITEFESDRLSFAKNFLAMFQFFYADGMPLIANGIAVSGTAVGACSSGTTCITAQQTSNLRLGMKRFVFHVELNDIASSGIDFSTQYLISKAKSTGYLTISTPLGTTNMGWMTDQQNANNSGNALLINLRYTLPFAKIKNPKIGYEFISADKKALLYDTAATDPVGFYTNRDGKGHHVYYIQPFSANFKAMIGYMMTERSSSNVLYGLLGGFSDVDRERKAIYTNLNMTF